MSWRWALLCLALCVWSAEAHADVVPAGACWGGSDKKEGSACTQSNGESGVCKMITCTSPGHGCGRQGDGGGCEPVAPYPCLRCQPGTPGCAGCQQGGASFSWLALCLLLGAFVLFRRRGAGAEVEG